MSKRMINNGEGTKKCPSTEEMLAALQESVEKLSSNVTKTFDSVNKEVGVCKTSISKLDERLTAVEKKLGLCAASKETSAKAEGEKSTKAEGEATNKANGESSAKVESESATKAKKPEAKCCVPDGIHKAFRYRDFKTKFYFVVADRWAAKQAGNGEYDEIWVYYKNGQIDHILSAEEIRENFA